MNSVPNDHDQAGEPRAAQLQRAGIFILLVGLLIAGLIYAFVPDNAAPDENSLKSQYYKKEELDTQGLMGGGGSLVLGMTRALRRPGTYSLIVVVVTVLAALICFFLASRHPSRKK